MKLSEIRKACEEATDGPWEMCNASGSVWAGDFVVAAPALFTDARFIALARTALPALLEAVTLKLYEEADHPQDGFDLSLYSCLAKFGIEVDDG